MLLDFEIRATARKVRRNPTSNGPEQLVRLRFLGKEIRQLSCRVRMYKVLIPTFWADFHPHSFAFRPPRQAVGKLCAWASRKRLTPTLRNASTRLVDTVFRWVGSS